MSEKEMREMVEGVGGEVNEGSVMHLPDGSGCCTASFPLPGSHWLYADYDNVPPMGLRCVDPELRKELEKIIWAAGRHAVRGATMNGKDTDFDPDALCQNLVVGLLGYHTPDALTHDAAEDPKDRYEPNPDPVPAAVIAIVREPS